jgi:hypothetical protein
VYDTLLFLHLLSAFIAFVTVAVFGAYAFGVPVDRPSFRLADWSWNISGGGLLVFGIWLALYVDGYELWDGWILGALGLFVAASAFGAWARKGVLALMEGGGEGESGGGTLAEPDPSSASPDRVVLWHWLRTVAIVGILALMIWKPGA